MRLKLFSKFLRYAALNESKKNFLAKQFKIEPDVVEQLSQYDPSPNNAYTGWLCRTFRGTTDDVDASSFAKYTEPLKKFMKLMNSPEFPKDKRDIGKYSPEDLLQLVGNERRMRHNLSEKEIERKIMTEGLPGAKLVWDGGGFKMWAVTNAKYARFLSSNTSWCTAQPDYSTRYCKNGALYPIYYLGKPFAQGYEKHQGGETEFLDAKDNAINFLDPIVLQMFDTIASPQMMTFVRAKLNKELADNIASDVKDNEESLAKFRDLIIKSDAIMGVVGYVISGAPLWEEGWELLLDYPQLLLRAARELGPTRLIGIKDDYPELAQDIAQELVASDSDDVNISGIVMTLMGDKYGLKLVPGLVDDAIRRGNKLPDTIIFNSTFLEEAVKIIMQKIKDMTEEGKGEMQDFLHYNKSEELLNDCIFAYWKRFVNRIWSGMHTILENYPEYKERNEIVGKLPKNLRVGATVTVGPDYHGPIPKGTVGVISEIDDDNKIKVTSDNKELENTEFTYNWGSGIFQLEPVKVKNKEGEWRVLDPLPDELRVGQRVIIGPDWKVTTIDVTTDDIATVTSDKEDDEGNQLVYITFDKEPERERGGFFYTSDIKRVLPVEFIKAEPTPPPPSELPEKLSTNDLVKRGPTWIWGDQDQGNDGRVDSFTSGEWTHVSWTEGGNNAYRYGVMRDDMYPPPDEWGPFLLDIIPVNIDIDKEDARHLSWTMAGQKDPHDPEIPF